jgi:hypothetical protein
VRRDTGSMETRQTGSTGGVFQFYGESGRISHAQTRMRHCEKDANGCRTNLATKVKRAHQRDVVMNCKP